MSRMCGGPVTGIGPLAVLALAAIAGVLPPGAGASAAEKILRPDLAACTGFTANDAAPFLGVPPERVAAKAEKVHATLWMCSFTAGTADKTVAFSLEITKDPKAAAAAMERYRADLEIAAGTAPFRDRLPKGAWSEIGGDGLGDENVWTDVNGSFTARKGNVTVQVTQPGEKLDKIRVGKAVLSKF